MKVRRLTLRDFRNVRDTAFYPQPGLNFIIGPNGQGKTSFLEALGFLSTLGSFRGSKAPEVIRFGEGNSEISCELSPFEGGNEWKTDLKISFVFTDPERTRATKAAFINGKPIRSSTQFLSQRFGSVELGFHSVVFNPSDHDLVRGEPSLRRSYLDRVIAAEDIDYLKNLQKFQKLLEQRNSVLKTTLDPDPLLLSGFTEPLAVLGAWLTLKRLEWLEKAAESLKETAHQIAPNQPPLRMIYLSHWAPSVDDLCFNNKDLGVVHFTGQGTLPSLELLEQEFWRKLSIVEATEWRVGHSLVGPQRDDWTFYQGNQILKGHGSQGEVRSALLALKLSEIKLFQKKTGHRPVFLLDDFSSELDQERRSFLLQFLSETDLQVFITTTDSSGTAGRRYWVENGNLTEEKSGNDRIESVRQ